MLRREEDFSFKHLNKNPKPKSQIKRLLEIDENSNHSAPNFIRPVNRLKVIAIDNVARIEKFYLDQTVYPSQFTDTGLQLLKQYSDRSLIGHTLRKGVITTLYKDLFFGYEFIQLIHSDRPEVMVRYNSQKLLELAIPKQNISTYLSSGDQYPLTTLYVFNSLCDMFPQIRPSLFTRLSARFTLQQLLQS